MRLRHRVGVSCLPLTAADTPPGLDAYILNSKVQELGTGIGLELRRQLEAASKLAAKQAPAAAARKATA